MDCAQVKQLFDAYLDGELSASLATEVGAHRLKCPECRRALALLEVSGHILSSDRDPVSLPGEFSDRLLACVQRRRFAWVRQGRRWLYAAAPLAAAAVVVLALLGVFDRGRTQVAGRKELARAPTNLRGGAGPWEREFSSGRVNLNGDPLMADERLDEWMMRTKQALEAKRESGESLQNALNLSVLQLLDLLEQTKEALPADQMGPPAPDPAVPRSGTAPQRAERKAVEDL